MKKFTYLLLVIPFTTIVLLISGFSGKDARYPGGSPAGYTGSPADGKDCTQCHNGSASPVLGWITSDVPDTGYEPGVTYQITATVSGSGDKGFLISPQTESGSILGTLIAGSGSKLVGSGGYITQTSSSSGNPRVWNFGWTAPAAGTGPVTFYGAFTVNKPVTKLCTLSIPENISIGLEENELQTFRVSPNPFSDRIMVELDTDQNFNLNVYNIMGQLVCSPKSETKPGSVEIDLSDQVAGMYFISLNSQSGSSIKKIIKR